MKRKMDAPVTLLSTFIIGIVVGMGLFSTMIHAPKGLENWLSAVGTIGAVFISLFLIYRPKQKGELRADNVVLKATSRKNPESGVFEIVEFELAFYIQNIGEQDVIIKEISAYFVPFPEMKFTVFNYIDYSVNSAIISAGKAKYNVYQMDVIDEWDIYRKSFYNTMIGHRLANGKPDNRLFEESYIQIELANGDVLKHAIDEFYPNPMIQAD